MKNILLEEKYVLEYIRDTLNSFKSNPVEITEAKYHHNASYDKATSILKYGILSLSELNRLGIKKTSPEFLNLMNDIDSHVNGNDAISLSVVGLTDLYPNETEYNPYNMEQVDFTISSDIRAGRSSTHYGNEFLCREPIDVDKLRSVDIRLFKLIESMEKRRYSADDIICRYNCLKDIALSIKESKLDIPLREMSNENLTLNIDKVSKMPKILLK